MRKHRTKYFEKNRDILVEKMRTYYTENREKMNQQSREYYQRNKDEILAKKTEDRELHTYSGWKRRLSKYGISEEEYYDLLEIQGGGCAICGSTDSRVIEGRAKDALSVDHCHTSGKVRGILCNKCNLGIGLLGDDLESLEKAYTYLKSFYEPQESSVV